MAPNSPLTNQESVHVVPEKYDAEHTENILHDKTLIQEARLATEAEHNMTFMQAIKTYRKAVFWSVLVSMSIVMEGYDTTLIGSFFAYPSFRQKYGVYHGPEAGYQLSSQWQAGITDIGAVGNIIGALMNGYFTHKYGHRKVMMVALASMTGFLFITFFAPNVEVLLIGAFLCSIPWGVYATMGPAYAAEVCPLGLRGYLTAYVNLCWVIGQLLSAAVLRGLVNNQTQWGYRIPFAIQWIWPIPLFIGAWFCPDSPWWLVRANRLEDAERSLQRLTQKDANLDHKSAVALMVHTTELEKEAECGTSYWDCFKGTNLRRTEIACICFLGQVSNGGYFAYSPTYFFEQAGVNPTSAYGIALGGTGLSFIGTCCSWFIMSKFGRRDIFIVGFSILICCLLLIGILACVQQTKAIKWIQSVLCLIWLGSYSASVGPIIFTIVAEIGATQLRTKTVVLGRSTYYVGNIIGGVLEPYMMNPTKWNWKGKTAFFWTVSSFLTTLWAFFRLPETKDRTYEELDIMFLRKIPARKFSREKLDENEVDTSI
ncbi:putative alpha-glucoside transport protein-2 [Coleophoma cylindrospora]|uniref:Putative alpha-glucoside transport protein-2 n=1 Tax=Coleophoma cylindrospora TaxID=1849047 RepID=A0A3D8SVG1_9HELO|nr:putative alpha-glucoside transport protein-2 [Coleophoma cylindrospora]